MMDPSSNVVLLILNDVPFVEEGLEGLIRLNVLVGEVTHLLHVDLLEKSADIDALNDLDDLLVELLVLRLELLVLFDELGVVCREDLLLASESLLLRFELGELLLLLDNVLLIANAFAVHLLRILLFDLLLLLHVNLLVQHLLALLLLDFELLEHNFSVISLILKSMLKLHCHLSLSLEMLGLLIGLSDASTLDLVLQLEVLLVHSALLSQRLFDLSLRHLLLILQILDAGLCNRDVNVNEICLLSSLHLLCNRLLGQVTIVKLASLLVLFPAVVENVLVQNIDILVESVTILLHLIDNLLLLGGSQLALTDVTIRHQVIIVQLVVDASGSLLLFVHDRSSVILAVHLALQTRKE